MTVLAKKGDDKRIASLDWLRGLMAISIMLFHYVSWRFGDVSVENPLGRLGIYGVSVFYVLSGISLAIVYDLSLSSMAGVLVFLIKRVFRILPLMWVATTLILILEIASHQTVPSTFKIFLNFTMLFGFIDPTAYLPTGAWSIGNEMVFYLLMPLVVYLYHKRKYFGDIAVLMSWLLGALLGFGNLNVSQRRTV